ncbi:MAG: hypothetical protein K2L08_00165, partial [Erysipelotrichaceae bacterium]|nr:hypothetical protein [Erysipelotrichaceae bacterium]
MKKRYKKQAKVAMAVALATTSLANSTGYALAKEETEVNEYNPIDNEKVNGDLVQEKQEAPVEEKVTEEVETETLQKVEEASETTENVEEIQNTTQTEGVAINEENFPDAEFRRIVGTTTFDKDQDGVLSSAELNAVTQINVNGNAKIVNLKGIEYFRNVTVINAYNTSLETIDVSKNTALTSLYVYNTSLKTLDVSKNIALVRIDVYNTPLEAIDVSKNTALQTLYAYNMPNLTSINVQGASALRNLYCYDNPKLKGLDVSGNPDLRYLLIKDSSYPGTNLAWLKMGAHPNLQGSSTYFKNATSTINIGEVGETFNLKDIFPDLDLDRVINMTGADIDLTTGEVSNYQDYDRTQVITYKYRSGTIQNNSSITLTVELNIETQALPKGQEITVEQGKEVDPADGILNKELLKEGATYEWEGEAPDTSTVGIVTGNIIVRYPDDSFHKVEDVRIHVGAKINAENFPDAEFRAYVGSLFDKNQDDILTSTELDEVTQINVSGKPSLTNLKGIEYFKNVTRIDAYNTSLEMLDISKNTALTTLYAYSTSLKTLDVSKNTALTYIRVDNTPLETIDVSKNTALQTLYVNSMPNLTSINLQGASALQNLYCYDNPKLKGLDVSGNSNLRNLWIKDSSNPGTNLLWLKMGAHPNLQNSTNYFKNYTSTITIGEVGETFNLKDICPDLDLSRITNVTGADIDLTTGVVSNYQDYDQTQTITYKYRGGTIQNNGEVFLTVQLIIGTQALPQGKEIIVAQGNEVDPAEGILNKDLLKEGATYEWEGEAPDTSEIGIVTGNIIVRYPDDSTHKVEGIRIHVGVELNTKNFPDGEFRNFISGVTFDKNQDGILTSAELDVVTEINVGGKTNLANLKGIEHFKNLR